MKEGIVVEAPQSDVEVAYAQIMQIVAELAAWGHNDSEIPCLHAIARGVREGTLSPEDGLQQARQIESTKQDYH